MNKYKTLFLWEVFAFNEDASISPEVKKHDEVLLKVIAETEAEALAKAKPLADRQMYKAHCATEYHDTGAAHKKALEMQEKVVVLLDSLVNEAKNFKANQ